MEEVDKDEDRLDNNNNNNTIHSSGFGCNKKGNTIIDFPLLSQSFSSQVLQRKEMCVITGAEMPV